MQSEKHPNIIFITFDSGRPDHLSFNGYKKKTTPFLDSLAERGVYFKNAYSTGPGSSVSFTGIFTSTYPLDYGGYSRIDRPRVLLPEVLKDAGYTTIGIHSSPYLSGYFGYNRGWDVFKYLNYFKAATSSAPPMSPGFRKGTTKAKILRRTSSVHVWLKKYISPLATIYKAAERILLFARKLIKDAIHFRPGFFIAEEVNSEVEKVLSLAQREPLFLWVHYLDTHVPYGLFGRRGRGIVLKIKYYLSDWIMFLLGSSFLHKPFMPFQKSLYDDSLRYIDEHIKKLYRMLEERGYISNETVVVVAADHGEDFLEHGAFGHEQRLFNVNIKVPLLFYAPGKFKEPQIIEKPVSLIDLAPTILDFAGAKRPGSFKGKNIFSEDGSEVIIQASECDGDLTNPRFTGIAIVAGGYKFFYWKNEKHLYAQSDYMERENLYNQMQGVRKDMEKRLEKYMFYKNLFPA